MALPLAVQSCTSTDSLTTIITSNCVTDTRMLWSNLAYLPMQNLLKMRSSTALLTVSPVSSPRAIAAVRRSIVQKSKGIFVSTVSITLVRADSARTRLSN